MYSLTVSVVKRVVYSLIALGVCNISLLLLEHCFDGEEYVTDFEEPIDIVYTWVNGSDPLHRAALENTLREYGKEVPESTNNARFRDWNEIKYSLRSIEMNVNWIRNIYIVVAPGQVPHWLNTSAPRITIVPHTTIFKNASHLPTFNSNAIESHLHRIPGLSNRFIYLNDDMFFAKPMTPWEIFPNKNQHWTFLDTRTVYWATSEGSGRDRALAYSVNILDQLFPERRGSRRRVDSHTPAPMDIRAMSDLQQKASNYFEVTSASKFRSDNDLAVVFLYDHYAVNTQVGIPVSISWMIRYTLDFGLRNNQFINKFLYGFLRFMDPVFFCINDDVTDETKFEPIYHSVTNFFESKFPNPSSFEKTL